MSAKIQIVFFFYFVFWDKKFLFLLLRMLEHSTSGSFTTAAPYQGGGILGGILSCSTLNGGFCDIWF
jgi:hypothetical protein